MRSILLLATLLLGLIPTFAHAQLYDSGWIIVKADDLLDYTVDGGGVRVNNFAISQSEPVKNDLAKYKFSVSVLKRTEGRRGVRVEMVGFQPNKTPTVLSSVAVNYYDEGKNKAEQGYHEFLAHPGEVKATDTYFIRVLVP